MICPRCVVELVVSIRHGIEIDYCPNCRGVWLDADELEKIIASHTFRPAAPVQPQAQPQIPQPQRPQPPVQPQPQAAPPQQPYQQPTYQPPPGYGQPPQNQYPPQDHHRSGPYRRDYDDDDDDYYTDRKGRRRRRRDGFLDDLFDLFD